MKPQSLECQGCHELRPANGAVFFPLDLENRRKRFAVCRRCRGELVRDLDDMHRALGSWTEVAREAEIDLDARLSYSKRERYPKVEVRARIRALADKLRPRKCDRCKSRLQVGESIWCRGCLKIHGL